MKVRIATIVLVLCLCAALLSGCGGGSSPASSYEPAVPAESASNATTPNSQMPMPESIKQEQQENENTGVEVPDPLTTVERVETYALVGDGRIESKQFSDGVAWATFRDSTTNEVTAGIINKEGELLYKFDNTFGNPKDLIITTTFINGLSAAYRASWSAGHKSSPGFFILNAEGKEVYKCLDDNTYMCGQTSDGKFVVSKHDSGFSNDEWYFYILDETLELKETGIAGSALNQETLPQFELVADGLYYYPASGSMLNFNNGSWYAASPYVYYNGSNGEVAFMHHDRNAIKGNIPLVLLNEVESTEELEQLVKGDSCVKLQGYSQVVLSDKYIQKAWHNGSFLHTTHAGTPIEYIDIYGNKLLDFHLFPDGVSYIKVDDFSGGYCALYLIGVDKKPYVTIIDESGAVQYDPVQVQGFSESCSLNGYIFLYVNNEKRLEIVGTNGQFMEFGDDFSDLDGDKYSVSDRFSLAIGDGYMYVDTHDGTPGYYSLDGSTSIKGVVAKYNERGQLLHTNESGTLVYDGASKGEQAKPDAEQPTNEKNYTSLSSFSIEGKWKNVGTYTFGQVDNGGIVSFDGTYCNLYSPRDTYALTKDGDYYRLDTTSLLGEATAFTVKIVDKDHIDIYYGSNYLELARVG